MRVKVEKIILDTEGSYLSRERGNFLVKYKDGTKKRYPMFENLVGEIILKTGNVASIGALVSASFWGIDTIFLSAHGKPVCYLKPFDGDNHIEVRICQYEALKNGKGTQIAREIVSAKIKGQNEVLRKYGLRQINSSVFETIRKMDGELKTVRNKLMTIEGLCSEKYFRQVFPLFREDVRPNRRKTFRAYDVVDNLFNLAYSVLEWKTHVALLKSRLEPYCGFLHSLKWTIPSLVCDFMEPYRFLMDDFILENYRDLKPKDFALKTEFYGGKKGKREFLNNKKAVEFTRGLNGYFQRKVSIPRVRMGNKCEIETLISEEALLLSMFLRGKKPTWIPRIVPLS